MGRWRRFGHHAAPGGKAFAVVCLVCISAACGPTGGDPPSAGSAGTATSPTQTTATTTTTTTTAASQWHGPPTLVTVDAYELVALDLGTGGTRVLAAGVELADDLGLSTGRFEGADLSPDGSTVAFAFGGFEDDRSAHALYEVPVDASAAATRVPLDSGDGFVSRPRYSPDGRFLAVHSGDRLRVLDSQGEPTGEGIQMGYPPHHVTWTPAGDGLVWLAHFERSSCCTRSSVSVDPHTGELADAATTEPGDGSPYFDPDGNLRSMPTQFAFDLDTSGGFVIASDGTPDRLLWWEVTADDPAPRELAVDLSLPDAPPIAW